jgi:ABC-type nitrate/sulfonate/bicarbonate transport system ATPase subunit
MSALEGNQIAGHLLDTVGLGDFKDKAIDERSGGMQHLLMTHPTQTSMRTLALNVLVRDPRACLSSSYSRDRPR